MTPALTEILFALELGDRVVGVTDFCDYPPEVADLARIGGYANPSVEAILALRPDLVLVSPAAGNRDAALAVERAGVRLEVVPAESLTETFAAIESVGRACGEEARGIEVAASVRARVAAAAARVRSRPRVRALFSLQVEPIVVAGRGTLPGEILELAGGENVIRAPRYPQVGIETILAEAPEVILQTSMDAPEGSARQGVNRYWQRWSRIPAVRNGRVFVFDGTSALRPGPRVADAVEQIASLLYATESSALPATDP